VGAIPKSSRSAFRNDADHHSGMKPVTDSDLSQNTRTSVPFQVFDLIYVRAFFDVFTP
jgi:hypothetical protein